MKPESLWALEQNLALMAGAGAGKTHALVTICLHLLGGVRPDGPLRPSQLCLVTFTDKAALELRWRLDARVAALALGQAKETDEPILHQAFAERGLPFPHPDFWRRIRDELSSAFIGTFHALCIQLLRLSPPGFGVDPGFDILDETEAHELIRDVVERTVLEALEASNPSLAELCRDVGFSGQGRMLGLIEQLVRIYGKVREEGFDFQRLAVTELEQLRAEFEPILSHAKVALAQALSAARASGASCQPAVSTAQIVLEDISIESGATFALSALLRATQALPVSRRKDPLSLALAGFQQAVEGKNGHSPGLVDCCAVYLAASHERAVRALLETVSKRHREELSRQSRLDFAELLLRARDLLRDQPLVRLSAQNRFRVLLADEFQDTNPVQLELVLLLSERREGGPRRLAHEGPAVLSLPLEQGFLCAVGDRKQSIYEFRGADVSVFELLAEKIEREGGTRHHLKVNRRSTPALLTFYNKLFAQVMAPSPDARDYEVAYRPDADDLTAHRQSKVARRPVQRILFQPGGNATECRENDAEAIARKIHQLLSEGAPIERNGAVAPARGGDIAVLFRRFSFLETYRQAFLRYGIPHRVLRGGGFYGAQEVLDVASLLAVLADPNDSLSFVAVLRSPLVALSDASLLKLVLACGERLVPKVVQTKGLAGAVLPNPEKKRLEAFLALFSKLMRDQARLGLRALLHVALEETAFCVSLAGMPYGEQAVANIEKLLAIAARKDAAGFADCATFSSELLSLAETDPSESEGEATDLGDGRAVQLLTVHQAKGLEWPIVVVPDMTVAPKSDHTRLLFERHRGLAIRATFGGELRPPRTARLLQITQELKRREAAEHRRLLYVALTRAKDLLILSGQSERLSADAWRSQVDRALENDASLHALVEDIEAEGLPVPAMNIAASGPLPSLQPAFAAVRRVRQRTPPNVESLTFTVTQLADHRLCPRRYGYAHVLGLLEHPVRSGLWLRDEGAAPSQDPRRRGSLVHRLLERVDFSVGGGDARARHLKSLLEAEGLSPESEESLQITRWARAFLESPFAQEIAKTPPAAIHRELPFLLRVQGASGPALFIKGQIDLLLDEEVLTVVDYKSGRRRAHSETAYAFQLRCYALAARRFAGAKKAVRVGLAFLQEHDPGPDFCLLPSDDDHAAWESELASAIPELAQAWRVGSWPGQAPEVCEQLACGFRYRCHGTQKAC